MCLQYWHHLCTKSLNPRLTFPLNFPLNFSFPSSDFAPHFDGNLTVEAGPMAGCVSEFTAVLYLSDDFEVKQGAHTYAPAQTRANTHKLACKLDGTAARCSSTRV